MLKKLAAIAVERRGRQGCGLLTEAKDRIFDEKLPCYSWIREVKKID